MSIDRTIIIALIFFVIIFLVFFFVLPEYNHFKDLQKQLGEKRAEWARKFDYYSSIDKIYYDLNAERENLIKIDAALPKNSDLGKLIYFLQETAKKDSLMVKNLFLSKPAGAGAGSENSSVKTLTFSINLEGDYSSLKNFMVDLEESSRVFEVSNISFRSQGRPPYTFNMQIRTNSY